MRDLTRFITRNLTLVALVAGASACGTRTEYSMNPAPVALAEPGSLPPSATGSATDEHKLEAVARKKVAVWPFAVGKIPGHAVGSGFWLVSVSERPSTNEAELVRATVTKGVSIDRFRRYQVVERVHYQALMAEKKRDLEHLTGVPAMVKAAQLTGAELIITGGVYPGVGPGEFFVEMALLDPAGDGERMRTKTGVCAPCNSVRLEAVALDLTNGLLAPVDLEGFQNGGKLPGSR